MSSTDERVTKDLIETLEDGKKGFATAAEKLAGDSKPEFAKAFREYSAQRSMFADELRRLAAQYGDKIDEDGSVLGSLHRGWLSIKDAVTGDDAGAVLDAAEQGEDHATSEYTKALQQDISPHLRTLVERQARDVSIAHDAIRSFRDRVK